jgi:hypothetical protein
MANLGLIFAQDRPNPLLGPAPVGLIGGIGFTLAALAIGFSPRALCEHTEPASQPAVDAD